MSIDITKEVVKKLSRNSLFDLFFKYHFDLIEQKTTIPSYKRNGSIYFPTKTIIKEKPYNQNTIQNFLKEYLGYWISEEVLK